MDLRIVTLENSAALKPVEQCQKREVRRRRSERLKACVVGLCIGLILGIIVCNSSAGVAAVEVSPSSPTPWQVTVKLENHAIAMASRLDTLRSREDKQVKPTAPAYDVPLTTEELTALLETCEAGHIEPETGLGLIQYESSFDPYALNEKSGCYGYCQLNPKYFPADLSPVDNIRAGIEYLAYQLERYDGDLEAALTAYNAGHDTGDRTYANSVLEAATAIERKAHGKENS